MGSPYINHFIQPDSIIPNPSNPQAYNRYSYVSNRPVNFNDPSGHSADCGIGMGCISIYKQAHNSGQKFGSGILGGITGGMSTSTPTITFTATAASTPTRTSVPTPIYPLKENAINLVQKSKIGQPLYDWAMANGVSIDYNDECQGYSKGKLIRLNRCINSDVYAAGQIAHETLHIIYALRQTRSQEEEYLAYMVGDAVRAELIAQGYGTGTTSDYFAPLTIYTVQFENNPNLELDLNLWFNNNGIEVYVNPPNAINGLPTGWGVAPFPLTYTPRP